MKLKLTIELDAETLPKLEKKLEQIIADLELYHNDGLREDVEKLDESNPFELGYYENFGYQIELF